MINNESEVTEKLMTIGGDHTGHSPYDQIESRSPGRKINIE